LLKQIISEFDLEHSTNVILDRVNISKYKLLKNINFSQKGYVHRLVNHSRNEYSDGKGNHINGLEGFWGYLKRKLSAKGGIRRKNCLYSWENMSGDTITEI